MNPSKTTPAYWLTHLKQTNSGDFTAQVMWGLDRERFQIKAQTLKDAAEQMSKIYCLIVAKNSLQAARDEFKPKRKNPSKPQGLTVGDWLTAIDGMIDVASSSLHIYVTSLRLIASEIAGVPEGRKRDTKGRGYSDWVDSVNRVPLSLLSDENVLGWRGRRLEAKTRPDQKKSARVSTDSYLGHAGALFTAKVVDRVAGKGVVLEGAIPFRNLRIERAEPSYYTGTTDGVELFAAGEKELPREQAMLLLLGLHGLRRGEADMLMRDQVNLEEGFIHVRPNAWFEPKSNSSERIVWLGESELALLKKWLGETESEFVVPTHRPPRIDDDGGYVRCENHYKPLLQWLRDKGIKDRTPFHHTRKVAGSKFDELYGVSGACELLGHKNIKTTNQFYRRRGKRRVMELIRVA